MSGASTAEKVVHLGFELNDGRSIIMTAAMSDAEVLAHTAHLERKEDAAKRERIRDSRRV